MMQNNYVEEDEIDLRELVKTIWKYKTFIVLFSIVVTSIAVVYVFIKPNIYQVDSVIKIGNYSGKILENPKTLVEILKIGYDVDGKITKRNYPYVSSVSMYKKVNNLIKISILALSKNDAKNLIDSVDRDIISKHLKLIAEYKKNILLSIKLYKDELNSINKNLEKITISLNKQKQKAKSLSKSNPSLSAIYMIEVLRQQKEIDNFKNKEYQLKNLISNKEMELLPINIKPTKVVKVLVYQNHVKPKRSLIIIVAFITSLILSIFLVFFIEFIKEESSQKPF